MVALNLQKSDKTLDEIHRLLLQQQEDENNARSVRKAASERYIGASSIGCSCERQIYYSMTGAPSDAPHPIWGNAGYLAAQDGHHAEKVMAERLRMVKGVDLQTLRPDGQRLSFNFGFLKGEYDGIITGILQAPQTPHIWEHKRANEKKFQALLKLKSQLDEKEVLRQWDGGYYVQAVIYMEAESLSRHYLTVSSDGGTKMTSVRTDANPAFAQALIAKAKRITKAKKPPAPISKNDEMIPCLFCRFKGICRKEMK